MNHVVESECLPADRIVDQYERREVSSHPFFFALQKKPVDLSAIWTLMANLRAGISTDFVRWLATTITRVEDRRIASVVAKQLDDELGNGEFEQIHSLLLDRFIAGLERWRSKNTGPATISAGRRMGERINRLFEAPDPYEGVGALIVGEIFAKKMDKSLGDQIRRQDAIPSSALRWLIIHESLEVDHADDSRKLAELVPTHGPELASTWRGAVTQWKILWEFLDDVKTTVDAGS